MPAARMIAPVSNARVAIVLSASLLLGVLSSSLAPAPAAAAPDRRELMAREAFGAGRYQDALDLYAKLYAEQLHPNYLRNIGRCYQDLGEPDKAISSFHEYLRKAKGISADERAEINGFIAEMEELKAKQQHDKDAAASRAAADQKAAAPPPVALAAPPPPSTAPAAPPPAVVVLAASPPEQPRKDETSPVYTRWWFWTIVGVVVAGGVGGAAAAGVFTSKTDAACSMGRTCR